MANKKSVPRKTRKFQLRQDNALDLHVQDILDFARSKRREVTLIRDAITLYWALEQGDLNILFERFPQYKAQIGQVDEIKAILAGLSGNKALPPPAPKMDVQMAELPTENALSTFLTAFDF